MINKFKYIFVLIFIASLYGCNEVKPYDYSEFQKSKPKSILVLPPKNNSVDVIATYSILSNATLPLSELGYYVFPVAVVDETFKQNGIFEPAEMHNVSLAKLKEIFDADSVLLMEIDEYGVTYKIISSEANVRLKAKLVDLNNGVTIWEGASFASSSEGKTQSSNPMAVLLGAIIDQVLSNIHDDPSRTTGKVATNRLLWGTNGVMIGPRHPSQEMKAN